MTSLSTTPSDEVILYKRNYLIVRWAHSNSNPCRGLFISLSVVSPQYVKIICAQLSPKQTHVYKIQDKRGSISYLGVLRRTRAHTRPRVGREELTQLGLQACSS